MADYLNSADSSDGEEPPAIKKSAEEQKSCVENAAELKAAGNEFFGKGEYEDALAKYTESINCLKSGGAPKDPLILLNRSATYLALKRYVPALNDANNAIEVDPSNWKGHWRKGISLMSMAKRQFRTKQAVEAFEACKVCPSLPESMVGKVDAEIAKARNRYAQQDAETPPPDLSNCAPS